MVDRQAQYQYSGLEVWDYVLPTGTSINPARNEGEYASEGTMLLVLFKVDDSRTRPTRVVSTYGGEGHHHLGQEAVCFHDQTNARLGHYRVVGIRHADGRTEGEVPDRKIKHSVFK